MQVINSPVLTNLTPINEPEYDGTVNVLPDRKCGWKINHPWLNRWIEGIQSRPTADEIVKAFEEISTSAYAQGFLDGQNL